MPISPMTSTMTDDLEYMPTVAISRMVSGIGMLFQLDAALESARKRNAFEHQPIAIPALPAPVVANDTEMKVDGNEVDDDSDTESTTSSVSSSRFSDVSSAESMTSVSSSSTSSSKKSVSFSTTQKVYVPPHRLASKARQVSSLRSITDSDFKLPHQLLSYATLAPRPLRRSIINDVDIRKTKASLNRYLYQGGETNVVGGGVMLGKAKKAENPTLSPLPRSATKKNSRRRADMVMLGPDVDLNWRRGHNVRV